MKYKTEWQPSGIKWKALHYMAKRFYSRILVSPYVTISNYLRISIVNDERLPLMGVYLDLRLYRYDQPHSRKSFTLPIQTVIQTRINNHVSVWNNLVLYNCLDWCLFSSWSLQRDNSRFTEWNRLQWARKLLCHYFNRNRTESAVT